MPLEYATAESRISWRPSRRLIIVATVVAVVSALGFYVGLRALERVNPYYYEYRSRCEETLRRLGVTLAEFEALHGRYPDSLGELVLAKQLGTRELRCHTQDFYLGPELSVEEFAAAVDEGRLSSYRYVGTGMHANTPGDAIVAFDRSGAHDNEGVNVLLKNGKVEWLPTKRAERVFADVEAGWHPPHGR